ncbi:MAG: hypothetical protein QOD06_1917 [Candidatus Binatota bacterium]|nr:hypothetical protein [Candidatus Binatota bacterium]
MATRESATNPFLQGNFAPWRMEGDAFDLEVTGEIPHGLEGTYYCNGPNPAYEPLGRYHWFDGDGMVHAVRLEGGRASYRNRWVWGRGLAEERAAGRSLHPGLLDLGGTETFSFKNTANTNVVWHGGKLLALVEATVPTELRADTLETVGEYDFGGRLSGPMTAHPKMDLATGEMLFFGYSPFPPYLQFHVADAAGRLVRSEPIDVAWPSMMHDFAVTERYVLFLLCPVVFSFDDVAARGGAFSWEPERGMRIGVMPRSGGDVRWLATDPCFVFHPLNAYEDGDAIVLDAVRWTSGRFVVRHAGSGGPQEDEDRAVLHRWRLDLASGTVRGDALDDAECEFPRVDDRLIGRRHRFGWVASRARDDDGVRPFFTAIRRYDLERGDSELREFGAGHGVREPIFVPRSSAAGEGDGYALVLVYDPERNTSDFWILDAARISGEPVARIHLPHRVPYGFHGNWVA